jgi:hypothetical protein
VRTAASTLEGYCAVMALVSSEPREWPTPITFLKEVEAMAPERRDWIRGCAMAISRGACTTWIGSGWSEEPMPRRS